MFGNNDNQQSTVGAPTTQSPSMLDNVNAQDFSADDKTTAPPSAPANDPQTPATPQPTPSSEPEHPITSDNPFIETATKSTSTYTPNPDITTSAAPQPATPAVSEPVKDPSPPVISNHSKPAMQSSSPVSPPATTPTPAPKPVQTVSPPTPTPAPVSDSSTADTTVDSTVPSVDTDKLASMKQQALDHLEPLVEHLDQKPAEEFRTTMMMIQANDNHNLLDKALAAAKKITDDKERAQAMLDIINEINYFSQAKSEE